MDVREGCGERVGKRGFPASFWDVLPIREALGVIGSTSIAANSTHAHQMECSQEGGSNINWYL
jgi:hypothetical protein